MNVRTTLSRLLRQITPVLLVGFACLSTSCATNPVTGKSEIMLMSPAQEAQLGAQSDQAIVAQYGLVADEELAAYVRTTGEKLVPVSHVPNQQFTFRLLDDPVVNAFALPGGYIYLTRGILAYLNDEAAMAGVLGHEIGHVAAKHSAKRYSQQQLLGIGLGLGSIFSETFAKFSQAAGTAATLLLLKFGRDDERQSDRLGVEYATKVGYDTVHMADFFGTLDRLSGDNRLPGWASTHPDPGERYQTVRQLTQQWQSQVPATSFSSIRDGFLQRLEGMAFGVNPRHGYVDEGMFLHPDLRFLFPVPNGWQVQNTTAQVAVVAPEGDAAVLFSIDSEHNTVSASAEAFAQLAEIQVIRRGRVSINGLPAERILASTETQQGPLGVVSTFVQFDGRIYVFHGLAPATRFNVVEGTLVSVADGFDRLRDPAALAVQPVVLHIIQTTRSAPFSSQVARYPIPPRAGLDVQGLAIVNGVNADTMIPAGTSLKVLREGTRSGS